MPTIDDYKNFLATIRKQTGLDMLVPDDDGLLSFRVDDEYTVNLQFIEASANILCFVEVATLPADAGVAIYRDLLGGSLFGKDTAGGYFALEEESNTIVYNYMFDFDTAAADPENFVETLENILQLVDIWAGRITGNLGNENSDSENDDDTSVEQNQSSTLFFRP
ncbi:MAG: type III secretion system chaperone [Victivallales bacterium]|nr:type III secretion system chaperone [Victivallales bacterium]MBO7534047.1 type III secretion system chaperone [Victivallales bacterium]